MRWPYFANWNALLGALLLCLCNVATQAEEVDYLSFATDDEANSTEIFSKASPSVVFVTNTALQRSFFTLNVQEIPRGSGTGFIWDKSGLIVTNFHVIAGAHRLTVTLQDQSEHGAQVIGGAPEKDLAVLRIEKPPKGLVSLPLGDSSELSVGRKVQVEVFDTATEEQVVGQVQLMVIGPPRPAMKTYEDYRYGSMGYNADRPFTPGETYVSYAGRVYDEREMVAAVDATSTRLLPASMRVVAARHSAAALVRLTAMVSLQRSASRSSICSSSASTTWPRCSARSTSG